MSVLILYMRDHSRLVESCGVCVTETLSSGLVRHHSIRERAYEESSGVSKPQGVFYAPNMKKLFVANGTDGTCKVLKGTPARLTNSLRLSLGADLMDYDAEAKVLYVGYGGRDDGKDYGEVAILDTTKETHIGDIQTSAHPGGMAMEKKGRRLFLTIPESNNIVVIDRKSQKIVN